MKLVRTYVWNRVREQTAIPIKGEVRSSVREEYWQTAMSQQLKHLIWNQVWKRIYYAFWS